MNATRQLHDVGQSLWLDNITRSLLNSGTLKRYIDELSVTGLTSNPTIFDQAIKNSADYDADIRRNFARGNRARSYFSSWRWMTLFARRTFSVPSTTAPAVSMAGSRSKCPLCSRTTRNRHCPKPRICMLALAARISTSRSPDGRRPAGHRGSDLRGRPGQCDTAFLSRTLSRGGRRLSARHRAAHRGRALARRKLGRLAVHQQVGCWGSGKGPSVPQQSARNCDRPALLHSLSRSDRIGPLHARAQRRLPASVAPHG